MSPAPFNLQGRNAVLVTRGGINAPALASALTDAGATLTTVSWTGGTDGLEAAITSAISDLGGIDILVNDLAADFAKPLADMTYAGMAHHHRPEPGLGVPLLQSSCEPHVGTTTGTHSKHRIGPRSPCGGQPERLFGGTGRSHPPYPCPWSRVGPRQRPCQCHRRRLDRRLRRRPPRQDSPLRTHAALGQAGGPRLAPSSTSPPTPAPSPPANPSSLTAAS